MAQKKQKKSLGKLKGVGARYGRKIKLKVATIMAGYSGYKECPYCKKIKVKRLSAGIWFCKKCNTKFAGKAYSFSKKINITEGGPSNEV